MQTSAIQCHDFKGHYSKRKSGGGRGLKPIWISDAENKDLPRFHSVKPINR